MLLVPPEAIEIAKDMNDPRIRVHVSGRFKCFYSKEKGGPPIGEPWWTKNGAVTVGLNYLLNSGFRGATQLTTWYIGIINASGYSAVAAGDTMSSHAGWTEFTGYSEAVRQTWSPAAASGGVVTSSASVAAFTINSSGNGQGVFVASDSTKSGTTGTLWATAVEAASFALTSGIAFNVIYEVTLTPVS